MNLKTWWYLVIREKCPIHKVSLIDWGYEYKACPVKSCTCTIEIIGGNDGKHGTFKK